MPTGFTEKIKDGISFRDFILGFVHEPPPDGFLVSSYHVDALKKTMSAKERVEVMTKAELEDKAIQAWRENLDRYKERLAESALLAENYGKMFQSVLAWKPPTEDHQELKKNALEQIKMSMKSDCNVSYVHAPTLQSGTEWQEARLEVLLDDQRYHGKEYKAELKRVAENNKWIDDLRASLPPDEDKENDD